MRPDTTTVDVLKTPERINVKTMSSSVGNTRMNPRFGYNGSPKNIPIVQSPGSVLSKASIFESKNSSLRTKDPAEMSLTERKALFERNKGEALIPKAPLTMSVPTKMLHEREKSSSSYGKINLSISHLYFSDIHSR